MEHRPLIIFGTGNVADIIGAYFEHHFNNVVAYTVSSSCINSEYFRKHKVIPFEGIEKKYPPDTYDMFIAIGYNKLNHIRAKFYNEAKNKGYHLVNYVDKLAYMDPTVEIGDNVFIFEFNNIQYKSRIGSNIILWSSNHIGHETVIRNHVYIASHVVISGFCDIGEYSFVGVNATFADEVKLGKNCLVGAGAYIAKNTKDAQIFAPPKTRILAFDNLSTTAQNMWRPEGV